jgi:hypothetical protein
MPDTSFSPDHRRALAAVAAVPEGITEAMFLDGFTAAVLVDLVAAGLASIKADRGIVDGGGRREPTVMRLQITDSGRAALGMSYEPPATASRKRAPARWSATGSRPSNASPWTRPNAGKKTR